MCIYNTHSVATSNDFVFVRPKQKQRNQLERLRRQYCFSHTVRHIMYAIETLTVIPALSYITSASIQCGILFCKPSAYSRWISN